MRNISVTELKAAAVNGLLRLRGSATEHVVALAPGRVNLIGGHTDYNDGFVLPMAVDRFVAVAGVGRGDDLLRAHSVDFGESQQACLADLDSARGTSWFGYVAGVAWALREAGSPLSGVDLALSGDVPIGAGLSSSAALEMAVARALCAVSGVEWEPMVMASLGRRAENEFVGVKCGIMDQFAAAASQAGRATLLDCRSLIAESVPLPDGIAVVVLDTGVRRRLAASAYNDRRASCEQAMNVLREVSPKAVALRDVKPSDLAAAEHMMPLETFKRASHVVAEIARPKAMADALAKGDLHRAGELMNASHASLRDLYDVSSMPLDAMVAAAQPQRGCFGARMTGAGFGGCAVALVAADRVSGFLREVPERYESLSGRSGAAFVVQPAAGARLA